MMKILYYKNEESMYLFVCTFPPSSHRLMNHLTQAHNICIDCSENFSWSCKHIFNFLCFLLLEL